MIFTAMTGIGAWGNHAEEWEAESQATAGPCDPGDPGDPGGRVEQVTHGCSSLLVGRTWQRWEKKR